MVTIKGVSFKTALSQEVVDYVVEHYMDMTSTQIYDMFPDDEGKLRCLIPKAIEAGVLPRKGKQYHPVISNRREEIEQFIIEHEETMSLKEIGEHFGISSTTIKNMRDNLVNKEQAV
jgi:predicted Zn-dependent protease with MMP-like domain